MTAARVDIVLEQGAPLNQTVYAVRDTIGNVIDLSQANGFGAMRTSYTSANVIPLGIELDQNGNVTLTANQAVMSSLNPLNTYVYDVYATVNGVNTKLVWGCADVIPSVALQVSYYIQCTLGVLCDFDINLANGFTSNYTHGTFEVRLTPSSNVLFSVDQTNGVSINATSFVVSVSIGATVTNNIVGISDATVVDANLVLSDPSDANSVLSFAIPFELLPAP